jgi:TonB-linked SusC/RagA family outer membrane protein
MELSALCKVPHNRGPLLTKMWMIMRITAAILLIGALHVSARGYAQRINLSANAISLKQAFHQIEQQTGYSFFVRLDLLDKASLISVRLKDASINEALDECLKDQLLDYEIIDKIVYIKERKIIPPPPGDIHGRVTDTAGNPLVGATVAVKGTNRIVSTNAKGEFTLTGADERSAIVVSYVGYNTSEFRLTGRENYRLIIALRHNNNPLDEVQVIGYGTNTKRFSVGSVSTVDAATIEKQPVTNVLLALEGQAPGLAINATSGVPGSQVLVQVRGQNTIADAANGLKPYDQPLFIVDGVPFAPQNNNINQLNSLASAHSYSGGISQAGGISPFNNINPSDIESITILKDADATSIYGTQGSNGVIIITTKKGKAGKTALNLNVNTGFNSDARPVQLLNTQQYLQLRKDAFAADGVTPSNNPSSYLGYAPDLTIFDQDKYTDWQNVIFGQTSNNTDIHGSISGGTTNNTFLISVGYTRSDYNFPGNYADQRWTMHSSFHHSSTNNRFTLDFITDYGYDQNNSAGFGGAQQILLPPNTPGLLNPDGSLIWSYQGVNLSTYQFYAYLKQPTYLQNYNLNNSLHLAYKILQGLAVSADLGYNRNTASEHSEDPAAAQSPLYAIASANFTNNAFQAINIEPQINYTKTIGRGVLSALLGGTYKKNTNNSTLTRGSGYANDNFLGSINGAATIYSSDDANIYKYDAGFARLKYINNQKYIVEFTGRRDGSSNFGPGRQFGNFGSGGAGWIFSEEKGFKKALPFISYGKLSGSYGTSGSDGIAAYQYQAFWQPINSVPAFQGVKPDAPENLYNPDYSWAVKKSLNLALDFGLFHDRLLVNATYYRDREGNQLVGYPLPVQTGFSSVFENLVATIQNKGWEFSLTSKNIQSRSFSWTTNFNISFNRNKLLSFPNLAASSYSQQYIVGEPTSIIFGYKYKDVNPETGLFEFYNQNGQVTSSPNYGVSVDGGAGDFAPVANGNVNYMGGLGNNLSYKHFSLYIFFQFSSQIAPNYLYTVYRSYIPGVTTYNEPVQVVNNYWKSPGDQATLQRLSSSYSSVAYRSASAFGSSSGVYGNDTYFRLKTVALSYSLPGSFTQKLHIQDCSVFVNAQNLLTLTNYKVGDPEQFGYAAFPLQRIAAFGLNLTF